MTTSPMRTFATGATRSTDEGKIDYEGFLSPLVIERFGRYMHENRIQDDGKFRASDNWKKGIPFSAYMKSLWRHFMALWLIHNGQRNLLEIEDTLCALMFNTMGYLHEYLRDGNDTRGSEKDCHIVNQWVPNRNVEPFKGNRRDFPFTPGDVNNPNLFR